MAERWWEDEATQWACGVFEGGGAKGAFYGPALQAVRGRGIWFTSVAGSSAGALTAAMVAAGADPDQLEDWTLEALGKLAVRRPKRARLLGSAASGLRDDPPRVATSTALLFIVERILREQVGRTDTDMRKVGRGFLPWIFPTRWPAASMAARARLLVGELVHELRSDEERPRPVTFAELEAATGIELFIVSVDAVQKRERVFHHSLTPDESVARAAVSSAAIPIYFPPGDVDAADDDPAAHAILFDGGVWSNFPTWVYKDQSFLTYHDLAAAQPSRQLGTQDDPYILGFLLDESAAPDGVAVEGARRPGLLRRIAGQILLAAFCAFTSPIYLLCLGLFFLVVMTATGCGALSVDSLCDAQNGVYRPSLGAVVVLAWAVAALYQFFKAKQYSGRFLPRYYAQYEGLGSLAGLGLLFAAERVLSTDARPADVIVDPTVATGFAIALAIGMLFTALAVLLVAFVGPAAYGVGVHIAGTLTSAGSARYWVGSADDDLVVRVPVAGIKTLDFDLAGALLEARRDSVREVVGTGLDEELQALADLHQRLGTAS